MRPRDARRPKREQPLGNASRSKVLAMVLPQDPLIAIGLVDWLAGAFVVTRWTTLLFGVRPTDPLSFAAVAFLLLGVGFLASYIPARRATT